jgi:hypothetical protein
MLPGGTTNWSLVGDWLRPAVIATFGPCGLICVHECSSAVPLPSSFTRWACVLPGRAGVSRGTRRLWGVHERYRAGSAIVTSSGKIPRVGSRDR